MYAQNFDMAHYHEQYEVFRAACGDDFDAEEIEIHDHVSEIEIDVTKTATNVIVDFLIDSDNPLVLSKDPVMIRKKSAEVNALVGLYARGVELNPGPTIADAEVADLNRIGMVMGGAHYQATSDNNRIRWRDVVGNIITSRPGIAPGNNNAAALLTRGAFVKGPALQAFPTLRFIRPGEMHKETLEYDGSTWATVPAVAANFKVKRIAHVFVARALRRGR